MSPTLCPGLQMMEIRFNTRRIFEHEGGQVLSTSCKPIVNLPKQLFRCIPAFGICFLQRHLLRNVHDIYSSPFRMEIIGEFVVEATARIFAKHFSRRCRCGVAALVALRPQWTVPLWRRRGGSATRALSPCLACDEG